MTESRCLEASTTWVRIWTPSMLRSVTLCKVLTMTFLWTPCPLGHPPTSFSQQSVLALAALRILFPIQCSLLPLLPTRPGFSHWVVSDSLGPHGLQHTRLPCPLCPEVCSDSCPLSWWCYLTISFLCRPFLLLPSIFPSIRVFSNELALCISWPKYWNFSSSISSSNEYRVDFL